MGQPIQAALVHLEQQVTLLKYGNSSQQCGGSALVVMRIRNFLLDPELTVSDTDPGKKIKQIIKTFTFFWSNCTEKTLVPIFLYSDSTAVG